MEKDKPGTTVIHVRNIPPDVKKKFHIQCVENNTTMNERIILLINLDLERDLNKQYFNITT